MSGPLLTNSCFRRGTVPWHHTPHNINIGYLPQTSTIFTTTNMRFLSVVLLCAAVLAATCNASSIGSCSTPFAVLGFNSSWVWTPTSASAGAFIQNNVAFASLTSQLWSQTALTGGGNHILSDDSASLCMNAQGAFSVFNEMLTCNTQTSQAWDVIQVGTGNTWKVCQHNNHGVCACAVPGLIGYSLSTTMYQAGNCNFEIVGCCNSASDCSLP